MRNPEAVGVTTGLPKAHWMLGAAEVQKERKVPREKKSEPGSRNSEVKHP